MKLFGDYHTHTHYSDGVGSIEQNVISASNKGLKQVAITDHSFSHMANGINPEDYEEQRIIIKELRNQYPEIEILHGVESNLMGLKGEIDVKPANRKKFDIVVVDDGSGKEYQNILACLYKYGEGVEKDMNQAYQYFMLASSKGHPYATYEIGLMFDRGDFLKQNREEAAKWYQKAADKDCAAAINNLGLLYEKGLGVKQDIAKAFQLYEKGYKLGNIASLTNLALFYKNGTYVKQDLTKAFNLYLEGTERNDKVAYNQLGSMYENGYGTQKDLVKAYQCYLQSANMGYVNAMNNVGYFLERGMGVSKNLTEALMWYEKGAAKLGKMIHPETAELLHFLLKMIAEKGEEKTFAYIRKEILKKDKKR